MVTALDTSSKSQDEPVYCNIYDMTHHNKLAYPVGLGIYHSAIQIFGKGTPIHASFTNHASLEYAFGGHNTQMTGIFGVAVKTELPGTKFRQSILIGHTKLSKRQVDMLILEMGLTYIGSSYNIISNNCNHFTDELAQRLCQRSIPAWVNRLAFIGSYFTCILPPMDFGPVPIDPDSPQSSRSDTIRLKRQ